MAALLLSASLALAPEAVAKAKRSGASSAPGFVACVQESILGRTDDECAQQPESVPCVGVRRALENSQKHSDCLQFEGSVCRRWSHQGRDESEWVSIAAAHLAKFGGCVKKQYGTEESSGLELALRDKGFLAFLKKLDDGGKVFRLSGSELLLQTLQENRFSHIIGASPFARERSPGALYRIQVAADNPPTLADAPIKDGEGSNPASEGETFAEFQHLLGVGEEIAQSKTLGAEPRESPRQREAMHSFLSLARNSTPLSSSRSPAAHPARLGLDRTLFERVKAAYQRQASGLSGMEEYLRAYAPPPPRDYSDLLKRGGTL